MFKLAKLINCFLFSPFSQFVGSFHFAKYPKKKEKRMVFACQRDSFQKELTSRVKSCTKGVNENDTFFEVICEDSILFPEGGGQPCDTGFINDIPVYQVLRRGGDAVLRIKQPIEVGKEVKQIVNWDRRFDHMQQHSGQHLITAIINAEYKIETTSWWLGEKISYIELDTKQFTDDQISHVESLVNEKILQQVPVFVKLCEIGDEALEGARTRGLPDDANGPIRIIEIAGIECDLCCGTHVSNLGQLQCIKLLYTEKGKKNKIKLLFLSGGRVLKYLSDCLNREEKLMKLLKNEPSSHVELVEKLQKNIKVTSKKLNSVLKEVAVYEAKKFQEIKPQPQYYVHYNKDADSDYLECFWRTLRDEECTEETFFMLAAGEESGNLLIHGNEEDVKILGPTIAELLSGKGVAHGTKFQGKVMKLSNFKKAEEILIQYFKKKSES